MGRERGCRTNLTVFTSNFKVGSLGGISILYGRPEGDTQKTLVVLLGENFKDSSKTVFSSGDEDERKLTFPLTHFLLVPKV